MAKRAAPAISKRWVCLFSEYNRTDKNKILKPHILTNAWISGEDIYQWLKTLKTFKCDPSIYLRGRKWRVYINHGTENWGESEDICSAFRKAFKKWKSDGMKTSNDSRIFLYVRENDDGERVWLTAEWRII
jgi:hypothetical protein